MDTSPFITSIIPGIWQHYKGPLYVVMGLARHANTDEIGVLYHGVEPHGETNEVPMWNWRPLTGVDGWGTPAIVNGSPVKRFTFLYEVNNTSVKRGTVSIDKAIRGRSDASLKNELREMKRDVGKKNEILLEIGNYLKDAVGRQALIEEFKARVDAVTTCVCECHDHFSSGRPCGDCNHLHVVTRSR